MFFNKNNNKFYDEKISQHTQGISSSYSHGITSDYIKIDKNKYFNTLKIANDNNFEINSFGGYTSNNLSFKKKIYDKYTKVNIFEKNVNSYINEKLNYITIGSYENLLFLLSATGNSKHDLALKTKKWIDNINDKKEEAIDLYLSSNNSETKDIDIAHFLSNPNVYTLSSLFDEGYTFSTNDNQQFSYSPLVIDLNQGGITGSCSVGLTSNFELEFQPNSNDINSFIPNNVQTIYASTELGMQPPNSLIKIIVDSIIGNEINDSDINDAIFGGHDDYPFPTITLATYAPGIVPIVNQETFDQTMNAIHLYNDGITFDNPYTFDDLKDYFENKDKKRGNYAPTSPFERHIKDTVKAFCGGTNSDDFKKFYPGFGPTSIYGERYGDSNGDGVIDNNEIFNDNYPVIYDILDPAFFGGDAVTRSRLRSIMWNTISTCCEFSPTEDIDWWSPENPCGIISHKECCFRNIAVTVTIERKGYPPFQKTKDLRTEYPDGLSGPNDTLHPWDICQEYTPPQQGWVCDCLSEAKKSNEKNTVRTGGRLAFDIDGRCVKKLAEELGYDLSLYPEFVLAGTYTITIVVTGVCVKHETTVWASKCGCPSCLCDRPECQGTTPPCEDETTIISLLKDKDLNYDASESIII